MPQIFIPGLPGTAGIPGGGTTTGSTPPLTAGGGTNSGLTIPGLGTIPPDLLNLLMILGGGVAGGLGTPSSTTTDTSGTTTAKTDTTSSGTQNTSLTPTLDEAGQISEPYIRDAIAQLATPFNTNGYIAGGINNINQNGFLQRQAIQNIMAAHGVSTSPVGATSEVNADQNRINQISQLENNAPLVEQQVNAQNYGLANSLFNSLPRGNTSTGTSNQTQGTNQTGTNQQGTQTNSSQGGGLGSGIAGALSLLAYLRAAGLLNTKGDTTSNSGGTATGNTGNKVDIYINTKTGEVTQTAGPDTVPVATQSPGDGGGGDVSNTPSPKVPVFSTTQAPSNPSIPPPEDLPVRTGTGATMTDGSPGVWIGGIWYPLGGVTDTSANIGSNSLNSLSKKAVGNYSPMTITSRPGAGTPQNPGTSTAAPISTPGTSGGPIQYRTTNPFASLPGGGTPDGAPSSLQDAYSKFGFQTLPNGNAAGYVNGINNVITPASSYASNMTMQQVVDNLAKSGINNPGTNGTVSPYSAPPVSNNPISPVPVNLPTPTQTDYTAPTTARNSAANINPGTLSKVLAGLF